MKPDEVALLDAMRAVDAPAHLSPRELGRRLGMNPKRVAGICAKWANQGIYEYGVCVDLGWLTKPAKEAT